MNITISRNPDDQREDGSCLLFHAVDGSQRPLVVAIGHEAWEIIQRRAVLDPIEELESMARHGAWTDHNGHQVWRVDVI